MTNGELLQWVREQKRKTGAEGQAVKAAFGEAIDHLSLARPLSNSKAAYAAVLESHLVTQNANDNTRWTPGTHVAPTHRPATAPTVPAGPSVQELAEALRVAQEAAAAAQAAATAAQEAARRTIQPAPPTQAPATPPTPPPANPPATPPAQPEEKKSFAQKIFGRKLGKKLDDLDKGGIG